MAPGRLSSRLPAPHPADGKAEESVPVLVLDRADAAAPRRALFPEAAMGGAPPSPTAEPRPDRTGSNSSSASWCSRPEARAELASLLGGPSPQSGARPGSGARSSGGRRRRRQGRAQRRSSDVSSTSSARPSSPRTQRVQSSQSALALTEAEEETEGEDSGGAVVRVGDEVDTSVARVESVARGVVVHRSASATAWVWRGSEDEVEPQQQRRSGGAPPAGISPLAQLGPSPLSQVGGAGLDVVVHDEYFVHNAPTVEETGEETEGDGKADKDSSCST